MPVHLIKRLGKQVLDALFYLYVHGFPFPHLHAGNVLINGENVWYVSRVAHLGNRE